MSRPRVACVDAFRHIINTFKLLLGTCLETLSIRRKYFGLIQLCEIRYGKTSFFWGVPLEWNKPDESLRESWDIKIFKSKRRRQPNSPSMLAPVYNKTTSDGSIPQARMRMGMSSLNAHRFKCNFIFFKSRFLSCQLRRHHPFSVVLPCLGYARVTLLVKACEALAPIY